MEYADIIAEAAKGSEAPSMRTIARFLRGDEGMMVTTIIQLAATLGLKPRITFEPIEVTLEKGSVK